MTIETGAASAAPSDSDLRQFWSLLLGVEPAGAFAEVRYKASAGMRQEWFGVRDRAALFEFTRKRGIDSDTYWGVAPRTRQVGGADAVERVHVLWADCDTADALACLAGFTPAPSLVVESGRGRHA